MFSFLIITATPSIAQTVFNCVKIDSNDSVNVTLYPDQKIVALLDRPKKAIFTPSQVTWTDNFDDGSSEGGRINRLDGRMAIDYKSNGKESTFKFNCVKSSAKF